MATVNRPYDDNKIVEQTLAVDKDHVLASAQYSNVIVAFDPEDRHGRSESVEVSWTTTMRLLADDMAPILDAAARP